jgi:hypothetical protein
LSKNRIIGVQQNVEGGTCYPLQENKKGKNMIASFRRGVFRLVASGALLAGCASGPTNTINDMVKVLGPGWQCFVAPSSFEAPGTLIRVDQDRKKWPAAKIAGPGDVETGRIAVGKMTVNTSNSLGAVLAANLTDELRSKGVDRTVSVSTNATAGSTKRLVVEFGEPYREVTYDQIKTAAMSYFEKNTPEPGSTYFLVREGLVAKRIAIQLDTDLTQELGGKVALDELVSLAPSVRRHRDGTYSLDSTYEPPLRACIKPERLVVESAGLNGKTVYKFVPQTDPIVLSP